MAGLLIRKKKRLVFSLSPIYYQKFFYNLLTKIHTATYFSIPPCVLYRYKNNSNFLAAILEQAPMFHYLLKYLSVQ